VTVIPAPIAQLRAPLPLMQVTIIPTGPRIDVTAQNYFPNDYHNYWVYSNTKDGIIQFGTAGRTVTAATSQGFSLSQSIGMKNTYDDYLNTSEGIIAQLPLGNIPKSASNIIGRFLQYPASLFPVGSEYTVIRQGDWGVDLDGDGINESFRMEWTHTYLGVESVTVPLGTVDAIHLKNTLKLTMSPSKFSVQPTTVTNIEDSWWASNVGPIKFQLLTNDVANVISAQVLQLESANLGGIPVVIPKIDGKLIKIRLPHTALVFDSLRNQYYASIPGSEIGIGNHIAIINATDGSVTYSASSVGSEPTEMVLAADGSALIVGLYGSGDVIKLALPNMNEVWRTRLPSSNFHGQETAGSLAVSPVDPNIVAASLHSSAIFPDYNGSILIRSGVLQPVSSPSISTVGEDAIEFDQTGQYLLGSGSGKLRKMQVLSNGLLEIQPLYTLADYGFKPRFTSSGAILMNISLYQPSDFTLLGRFSSDYRACVPISAPGKAVCLFTQNIGADQKLAVTDTFGFGTVATPILWPVNFGTETPTTLVAGPRGQVAVRINAIYPTVAAPAIWLFTSPAFN
jgi:DNA-binding beta-propeller fold protein YncE